MVGAVLFGVPCFAALWVGLWLNYGDMVITQRHRVLSVDIMRVMYSELTGCSVVVHAASGSCYSRKVANYRLWMTLTSTSAPIAMTKYLRQLI